MCHCKVSSRAGKFLVASLSPLAWQSLGKENVAQRLKYLNHLSVTVQKIIVYRALNTRKEWLD